MAETYAPRRVGLPADVVDRAWIGTPCETYVGRTPCGKPSTSRYPAMGGGWHHMCPEHGARHANISEHADGSRGAVLVECERRDALRTRARRTDQRWRNVLLATPIEQSAAQTVEEVAAAMDERHAVVGPVLTQCYQQGAVERARAAGVRANAPGGRWRYWRLATDAQITAARSLRALGRDMLAKGAR